MECAQRRANQNLLEQIQAHRDIDIIVQYNITLDDTAFSHRNPPPNLPKYT